MSRAATPLHPVRLDFPSENEAAANLSAVERVGQCLFVASDEGTRIERLVRRDERACGWRDSFALADAFNLPAERDGEADIEGMSADDGWLWVIGSHSLARRKPKKDGPEDEALERLTEVRCDPNRWLLGRIPLVPESEGGVHALAASDAGRMAACLKTGNGHNSLTRALKDDEHLGRFLTVPAKENGFDIEGMAVRGDRLFVGLRGPVLRGWACILELSVKESKPGRLKLRRIGPNGERFRKHFLDLDGLGIRDLALAGNDLLILAGPTMDLDGPVAVWRWADVLDVKNERIIPRDRLTHLLDLPFGPGTDHAEGIAIIDRPNAAPTLLVVYDSPDPSRCHGASVDADLFALPSCAHPGSASDG